MKLNKRILFLIQQAGTLLQMPRTHIRNLGNSFDTIASHSHHVSLIAYCIARMEGLSHSDGMRALTMGALHDLAEGRMPDLDFVAKNYVKANEQKAVDDQFKGIDFGPDLKKMLEEYEERKTKVSKCTKDADQLGQMYMEWALMWRGNKLAQQWFEGGLINRVPSFYTESAKQLALSMKDSNPNEWWWSEFVTKDGKPKKREHLVGREFKKKKN